MNISIAIMAHPKRQKEASALLKKLIKYPFSEALIIWDQKNEEWDTGQWALRAGIASKSDWHIVIQDDAIISANFYDNLVGALSVVPIKSLISLYTGTVRPFNKRVGVAVAKAKNASWLRSNLLYWGVGIAMPTSHITEVLDFIADRTEPYDFRIGWAYQRNRLPVFYTNPSLVDHNNDLGSLIGNGRDPEPRVARNFAGSRLVTWNNRVIDI